MTSNQYCNISYFEQFVESGKIASCPRMTAERVIPSFLACVRRNGNKEISDRSIRLWIVDMLLKGMKQTTCRRYVYALRSLYRDMNVDKHSGYDPFESVKEFTEYSYKSPDKRIADNLSLLRRLLKKDRKDSDWIISNVIQYLFYNVDASLEDVVSLRFGDICINCPQTDDIVESMRLSPQQKYVFPLYQGKKRNPRIISDLIVDMKTTLRSVGMDFGNSFSRESLTEMWIASALGCGISVSEIRGIIPSVPSGFAFLSLIEPAEINETRKTEIVTLVAETFNDKTIRWYVMKLRTGVTPDDITGSLPHGDNSPYKELSFYYPVRKNVRRNNKDKKKMVTRMVPYLPGLLFFRLRSDKVGKFMSGIGNMAWCYRRTNSPDSPYSYITQHEMTRFQRHIGKLTSDIEIELINHRQANIGDKVKINGGGLLDGMEGIVREICNTDGTRTYVLRLSETSFIRWNDIRVEEAFIEHAG